VTQPPVRYENYPPDDSAPSDGSGEHTPVIRPFVPDSIPPPQGAGGRASSRRTVIGLAIGIPVAGIILSSMAANSSRYSSDGTGGDFPDYGSGGDDGSYDPGSDGDPGSYGQDFTVGAYKATAPAGWTVNDDGTDVVAVSKGANRLTAVSLHAGTSTVAVDDIAHLAKRHYTGFKGKIADPVEDSSADVQHATMDGTGKFSGKPARLLVELWIDDQGSGLLVTRVITAKATSVIASEAQGMLQELSEGF
jgi:hypothetical protein